MADAQEVLDSEGGCPEKQEWTQGRVSVVLEKRVQSPKEWQKHNQWEGIANNWGVAATEDISDGAWPDTELASYILQVVGPTELNSREGKCTLNPQKWLCKNCILKQ